MDLQVDWPQIQNLMRTTIQSARDGASPWANAHYDELNSKYAEQDLPSTNEEKATRGKQYLYLIQKVWMVRDADMRAQQVPERLIEIRGMLERHISRVCDVNASPDQQYKLLRNILQAME